MFSSTRIVSTSIKFVYVIVFLIVLRTIYVSFFKPLDTVKDYLLRSNAWLRCFRAYDKAIEVLKQGTDSSNLSLEDKQRLLFAIGVIYFAKREYKTAAKFFDQMQGYFLQQKIPFDENYCDMLICYDNIGERGRAKQLYQLLLKQAKHDERFREISRLEHRFM